MPGNAGGLAERKKTEDEKEPEEGLTGYNADPTQTFAGSIGPRCLHA